MKIRYFARVTFKNEFVSLYRFSENGDERIKEQWTKAGWVQNEAAEDVYGLIMFKGEPVYDELTEAQAKEKFPKAFA